MPAKNPTTRLIAVILVAVFAAGCVTKTSQRSQKIRIYTDPQKAYVWTEGQDGKRTIGRSPTTYEYKYETRVQTLSPWWWVGIGALGLGGSVGLAFYQEESTGGKIAAYSGGIALLLALTGYYLLSAWKDEELPVEPVPLTLGASAEGYLDNKVTLQLPSKNNTAKLVLRPDPERTPVAKPVTISRPRVTKTPSLGSGPQVIAVFDIQDSSRKFSNRGLDQLTEYLVARLTQVTRFRVIPRDQLRDRLVAEKKGTHRRCYEESCQIEMGKALAAQKSLATKILMVGKRCAVTSTLYDLKTETAEKSALSRTDCSDDALMDAMDRVARQLSGSDYR